MNVQIRVTKDQSAALLRAVRSAGARALPVLGRAMASGAQEVLGRAVKNRFTGKGPFPVSQNRLGVVTNRLRKSMRATLPQVNPAAGTVNVSMGSNVSYYGPHEFGFRGRVQVKGHTRRAVRGNFRRDTNTDDSIYRGKLTRKTERSLKANYRRGRANYSYVKPHARRVNIPARAPLGTELASVATRLTFFKKFGEAIRLLFSFK